ncbi:BspA family leucine-rich repeat surface protein [Allomuricauda sp. NBRC 101325]|uniref:BspA family leucine-rich repeat surface protein n=1 Tax=Allomuricauda sp. NBRC 101325 TaxID=1113758 RepID=UPI0024A40F75|nr:BspA family leucine-rich repeat surface protein [Muricauda sp. NBRC 101325]GLU45027.1 hypothetical protein Musp01_26510 [Muricauda sp. NBRC 101325]
MMKKIAHFGLPIILGVLFIWACSKDEDPAPKPTPDKENTAPTIEDQSVSVAEDKQPGQIGKINASDDEGDTLNFAISGESPFNLAKTGELSLAVGQTLNFEQTPKYDLTVIVNDGTLSASATITVNVTNVDEAPELTNETTEFSVEENIADDFVFATLTAEDPEGGNVNFEIVGDNTLFEIDEQGQLSLIQGQILDFEAIDPANLVQNITIRISDDGGNTVEFQINITINNVIDTLQEDPNSFITTWETSMADEEIQIGIESNYSYDFSIDWGDGVVEDINVNGQENISHIYKDPDTYSVAILRDFPALRMFYSATKSNLKSVEQWGSNPWVDLIGAFMFCDNMISNAKDAPNLSEQNISLHRMFYGATSFDGDLSNWDTQNVSFMSQMFSYATAFNGNVSTWNTSNVTSMNGMFREATTFNKDISNWNVSKVTNLSFMFTDATTFNQNLGKWNIESLNNAFSIFANSGMSEANYSNTLIGWATLDDGEAQIPVNVNFNDQAGMVYCNQAAIAIEELMFTYGWAISGDSPSGNDCNP